ncbi:protein of unknown function [Paraburkholderia dioscoreae]|uniref:Uncharacterized protein n=1 Tax=Paraburkholderia dioscoreae TaxID=2604047 RepID=A0A5Q4YVU1_9BURK|nr:protein of unknown function [Paraburkholderia dioscoreae]
MYSSHIADRSGGLASPLSDRILPLSGQDDGIRYRLMVS